MLVETQLLRTLKEGEKKAYVEAKPMLSTQGTLYIGMDSYSFTLNTDTIDHGMILVLSGATTREYMAGSYVSIGESGGQVSQYITYDDVVAGDSVFANNIFDVSADLGAKYC